MDLIEYAEQGYFPDPLCRRHIRRRLQNHLADPAFRNTSRRLREAGVLLEDCRNGPIGSGYGLLQIRHDGLGAAFYEQHLGPYLKQSCCDYSRDPTTLADAENAMFERYVERAELRDGQRILDLGGGWGGLSMWLARRFPNAQIVTLCGTADQYAYLSLRARSAGLANLAPAIGALGDFEFRAFTPATSALITDGALPELRAGFDRILAIESFARVHNIGRLLAKLAAWMMPDGRVLVQSFAHGQRAHWFPDAPNAWLARHFLTQGLMPDPSFLLNFQDDLRCIGQWWFDGRHYARTANHWLVGLDRARLDVLNLFRAVYPLDEVAIWFQRWRLFYMTLAEVFGYEDGNVWGVAQVLLGKR